VRALATRPACWTGGPPELRRIQFESGGNQNAINVCVPPSTVILTRRGWLDHSQVRAGDETIGYNQATGKSEWTRITAVHHYADSPLVRIGNSRWHATTTPNHRWLNLPRTYVPAEDLPDQCPHCLWPNIPAPSPLQSCPECGWLPKAPGGVALHRRRKHGVVGAKASGGSVGKLRRRGKTTAGGLRIHLAKAHGIQGGRQQNTYTTETTFVTTADVRSRDRLLLAAPAETPSALNVTVKEAAILGWIAGDGHVEKIKYRPTMSIAQSKPVMIERIKDLLSNVPHTLYVDKPRKTRMGREPIGPRHVWRIQHEYAQDLLQCAGHPKADAMRQVLDMSPEQRDAWYSAIIDAEGHLDDQPNYTAPKVSIHQTYGPVLDAIVIATYLSGHRPRILDNKVNNPRWRPSASVFQSNPVVTGAFLQKANAGTGDVWCVTTELGTWTAEEDGHVFVTGNSDSNAKAGHRARA